MLDDRVALAEHIRELREEVSGAGLSVSPEARLTAHAALVQAEAMMLLSDAVSSAARTAVSDVVGPLIQGMAGLSRD
jgi:predicted short-subunit dehydrogenase-like oxidoreductase (DUF2520 family)